MTEIPKGAGHIIAAVAAEIRVTGGVDAYVDAYEAAGVARVEEGCDCEYGCTCYHSPSELDEDDDDNPDDCEHCPVCCECPPCMYSRVA